jgi:hypothetical protein
MDVDYMPPRLETGVLYVSQPFTTAAHLCACGCGTKVRTPLGPTEWVVTDAPRGPSLHPSVGNWQMPCRSHYWITDGEVEWAEAWSDEEVAAGRHAEATRRAAYFDGTRRKRVLFRALNIMRTFTARLFAWLRL